MYVHRSGLYSVSIGAGATLQHAALVYVVSKQALPAAFRSVEQQRLQHGPRVGLPHNHPDQPRPWDRCRAFLETNQGPRYSREGSLARGPLQCQSEHYNGQPPAGVLIRAAATGRERPNGARTGQRVQAWLSLLAGGRACAFAAFVRARPLGAHNNNHKNENKRS